MTVLQGAVTLAAALAAYDITVLPFGRVQFQGLPQTMFAGMSIVVTIIPDSPPLTQPLALALAYAGPIEISPVTVSPTWQPVKLYDPSWASQTANRIDMEFTAADTRESQEIPLDLDVLWNSTEYIAPPLCTETAVNCTFGISVLTVAYTSVLGVVQGHNNILFAGDSLNFTLQLNNCPLGAEVTGSLALQQYPSAVYFTPDSFSWTCTGAVITREVTIAAPVGTVGIDPARARQVSASC
jgi:hypothetical protein